MSLTKLVGVAPNWVWLVSAASLRQAITVGWPAVVSVRLTMKTDLPMAVGSG